MQNIKLTEKLKAFSNRFYTYKTKLFNVFFQYDIEADSFLMYF